MSNKKRLKIWFVPGNSSHMPKNSALLNLLASEGHDVKTLCIDNFLPNRYLTKASIVDSGFAYVEPPQVKYHRHLHWLLAPFQRSRIVNSYKEALQNTEIDSLILGGDVYLPTRALVGVANRLNVPTFLLIDGIQPQWNLRYKRGIFARSRVVVSKFMRRAMHIQGPRGSSGVRYIFTLDESSRRFLVESGHPETSVFKTGSPEYDALSAKVSDPAWIGDIKKKTFDRLGISPDRGFAFFVHQELGLTVKEQQSFYMNLIASLQRQELTLVVKLHPRASASKREWAAWASEAGLSSEQIVFVSNECASVELCVSCNLCISVFSTVVIEALICRKPIVLVDYLNVAWRLPYGDEYRVFERVNDVSQLDFAIKTALDSAEQEDMQKRIEYFLSEELYGLDGKSVQRMRDLIVQLSED